MKMPNVFSIADDLLLLGYGVDDRYHGRTLRQMMQICQRRGMTKLQEAELTEMSHC